MENQENRIADLLDVIAYAVAKGYAPIDSKETEEGYYLMIPTHIRAKQADLKDWSQIGLLTPHWYPGRSTGEFGSWVRLSKQDANNPLIINA